MQQPSINVTPPAAQVSLVGEPVAAMHPLAVRLVNSDREIVSTVAFRQGERIVAQLATVAGAYTLGDVGDSCAIDLVLEGGKEIDVVIHQQQPAGCELTIRGVHGLGEGGHSQFGTLSVRLAGQILIGQATVRLKSLDAPPNPVPEAVNPDESGRFFFDSVPAGRYEAQVIQNAAVVGKQQVEIGIGADAAVSAEIQIGPPP